MNGTSRPPARIRPVFALAAMVLLVAIAAALRHRTEPERNAAALDAIRQTLGNQQTAWNDGDLEGFMTAYCRAADSISQLTVFVGDTCLAGWQAVHDCYQERYPTREQMGTLKLDWKMELLSPDAALVSGEWHVSAKEKVRTGLFTRIYRKLPEGWRITHESTRMAEKASEIVPPPGKTR